MSNIKYLDGFFSADDGAQIFYRRYGYLSKKKVPVLCLSGLTRNSSDFHELALKMCQDRMVIVTDYRGRGKSEYSLNWRKYTPEIHIFDIHQLLAILNIKKLFIIGTSLGGIIGMGIKVLMPKRVIGILLNDIGPELSPNGLTNLRKYMVQNKVFHNWSDVACHLQKYFPELGDYSITDWIRIAKGSYKEDLDGSIKQNWDPRLRIALGSSNLTSKDLWRLFLSLRRDHLATLRGENSNILSNEVLLKMSEKIPQMKTKIIPGAGHAPTLLEAESQKILMEVLNEADATYSGQN